VLHVCQQMPSAVSALRSSYRRLEDTRRVTVQSANTADFAAAIDDTASRTKTDAAAEPDDIDSGGDITFGDVDLSTLAEVYTL